MLSRVLTGRDASVIPVVEFPQADHPAGPVRATPVGNMPPAPDIAEAHAAMQRLEAEIPAIRRQAFEAGRAEGEQRARAEFEPVAAKMNAAISELVGLRSEMRRRAERDVVQLALMIAKRVLHRELNVDENAMAALARVAFDRLSRAERYKITVHPGFVKSIAAAVPASLAAKVQIEPDPSRDPGTLVIDSPDGRLDASIDTQLEEIGRGLADRLGRT
jgi:flagellar assembly protein FliH